MYSTEFGMKRYKNRQSLLEEGVGTVKCLSVFDDFSLGPNL